MMTTATSQAKTKMISILRVTDYDTWFPGFKSFEALRTSNGVRNPQILRGVEDTNTVAVICDVDDVTKAQAFMASAPVQEGMKSVGVLGPPITCFA
jgi:hypothetical protein